ncbi:MAG TPA: cytochrome c [Acetobacteraceae bacterium]|jgi:mono/diheme cytochrome c family protein|nr:cytochrome c [Acetobacteraceae bacterium]
MRTAIVTLLAALLLALAGTFTFIYAGIYNVAATQPHWPITFWAMETVRQQSVKRHASGMTPPPDLASDSRVLAGTEHYAAHCALCHGAPGVPRTDLAQRLYPLPADLTHVTNRYTPGELFWVLKNGIKMSGMPSWMDHSDDELWATVAFLERLPNMKEADYATLMMARITNGGDHQSHGMQGMDHSSMPGMQHAPDPHQH